LIDLKNVDLAPLPLQRITSVNLISSKEYDKEKYLEMPLNSAEAVLSIFGFNRSLFGFDPG
jgi:hypothetical protein